LYKNKKHFIGLALEDGNLTDKYSRSWIKAQYSKEIYGELKNKLLFVQVLYGVLLINF
jgi:hypothetical protein